MTDIQVQNRTTGRNEPLNKWQKILCEVYGGGDFADLADKDYFTALGLQEQMGDTLFRFLLIELSTHEDCDSDETALQRLRTAGVDIGGVFIAIQNQAETPWPDVEPEDPSTSEPVGNYNEMQSFFHCGMCFAEWQSGEATKAMGHPTSMREYAQIEVGNTPRGIQIWCKRHEVNIAHIDFEGYQHPANVSRKTDN